MRDDGGSAFVLVLALVLLLAGGLLAWSTKTDFGAVEVERLRAVAGDGRIVSQRLYRPRGATPDSPAPAVLAVHGDDDEEGALAPYAIELARRGYVVLSVDRPGHGRSAPAAPGDDLGGPAALATLRRFPFVDADRIVLVGHGSGATAVLAAALAPGGAHSAIVLLGAAPADEAVLRGGELRNVALVLGRFDEFTAQTWGVPSAASVGATDRLRALFGAPARVVPGEIHGSIREGTGRVHYLPGLTHHGLLVGGSAIAPVIDWVQRTTPAPEPRPPNDQLWMGWAIGSGMVLAGFVLALFGASNALLGTRTFGALRARPAPAAGLRGFRWSLAALVATAVPALTYVWAFRRANDLVDTAARFVPGVVTGVMGWGVFNAAIALVVILSWWLVTSLRGGVRSDTLGLRVGGSWRVVLFATLVVGSAHGLLALVDGLFRVDPRAWVVMTSTLDRAHALPLTVAFVPFVLVFAVVGMLLHALLRPGGAPREGVDALVANGLILSGGLLVLLLVQYVPLFADGAMPFGEGRLSVLAIELAAVFGIAGVLSTYLFVRTASVWPGALVNGLWVAAYLVTSSAAHAVP